MITVDFKKICINPGFKILDVGCGSGRHTCAASRLGDIFAIGSDIKFDEVKETRKRLLFEKKLGVQNGSRWAAFVADITALPFKDKAFDLVICSEVLEHVPMHETAAVEITRVLKTGRTLVVSVPRYFPERLCWTLSHEYHNANGGHIRIYRKKELIDLLESTGLKQWTHHFAHSLHTPYWWLKCLVGPTREDSLLVNFYHQFLVWDMMKGNWMTRLLERLLNPLFGKSTVVYLRKEKHVKSHRFSQNAVPFG